MNEDAFRHTSLSPPIYGWSVEGSDLMQVLASEHLNGRSVTAKNRSRKIVNAGRGPGVGATLRMLPSARCAATPLGSALHQMSSAWRCFPPDTPGVPLRRS